MDSSKIDLLSDIPALPMEPETGAEAEKEVRDIGEISTEVRDKVETTEKAPADMQARMRVGHKIGASYVSRFSEGYAIGFVKRPFEGKYNQNANIKSSIWDRKVFIDRNGQTIPGQFLDAKPFSHGYAPVKLMADPDTYNNTEQVYWCFINKEGVVEPKLGRFPGNRGVRGFNEKGYASVNIDGKQYAMDTEGKLYQGGDPEQFGGISEYEKEQMASSEISRQYTNELSLRRCPKGYYVKSDGQKVPGTYDGMEPFYHGRAIVRQDVSNTESVWYMIDENGNRKSGNFKYPPTNDAHYGMGYLQDVTQCGVEDNKGKVRDIYIDQEGRRVDFGGTPE